MRRVHIVLGAVLLLAGLTGGPALGQARGVRIAFIGKSYANPVFLAAHSGALAAARELSQQHGLAVQVEILTPQREDAAAQAAQIRRAGLIGFDAIAVAPSDAAQVGEAVAEVVAKGVAVMTFDADLPRSGRFAHFGIDDEASGERLVEELLPLIGGQGPIAVLAGNPEAPNLQARVAGVRRGAERLGVEVVGVYWHEETAVAAVAEVIRVNREHPEVKGWALVGGWPMFRSSASLAFLRDIREREQKLAAIDGLPDQLHYAEKGLAVLLAQPVYDWGTVAVSTIVDHVVLSRPVPEYVEMQLVRVTADNLGEWARTLASWGFTLPEEYLAR
jgi:ribose transport system substrate-binding protein